MRGLLKGKSVWYIIKERWVRSSEEERLPYEQKVVGSSPAAPTKGVAR